MILAEAFKWGIDPLEWQIIPRFHIFDLAISPHGIGIALGYLAGAQLMVRRARKRGGPDETDIWNVLFWALLGAIVGARAGYVLGHLSEVTDGGDDLLGIVRVWEGGISLLGGITGAVLAGLPYMIKRKMGFWRTMDLAAPGLALGIVIGRIGDLMIGDHLGKPTSFALGWLCLGNGGPPVPSTRYEIDVAQGTPPSLGCFDVVVHQTALYDFVSTLVLLGVLLWLGRKVRRPGFMILVFTLWYGAVRVLTDFLRVDKRYLGLTGSQITSIVVGIVCLYLLARHRGAPPRFAGGPYPDGGPSPVGALVPSGPGPLEGGAEAPLEPAGVGPPDAAGGRDPGRRGPEPPPGGQESSEPTTESYEDPGIGRSGPRDEDSP